MKRDAMEQSAITSNESANHSSEGAECTSSM